MQEFWKTETTWEDQFDRMIRWYQRMKDIHSEMNVNEQNDIIYACIQNIFFMKDWCINSRNLSGETKKNLDTAFGKTGDPWLGIIRDICNGTKHYNLDNSKSIKGGIVITS